MEDTALITTDNASAGAELVQRMAQEEYRGPQLAASFEITTPQQKAKLFNTTSAGATPISECNGMPLSIHHYVFQRGLFPDEETGEMKQCCRLWLIDPEGNAYFSAARSVIQEIARIIPMFGAAPYDPPLQVAFHVGQTRGGRKWWHCEVLASQFED